MSKKFEAGARVKFVYDALNPALQKTSIPLYGRTGTVTRRNGNDLGVWVRFDGDSNEDGWHYDWRFVSAEPTGKVRMLERGKLLDTEFDSPVAAGDWLRENGITGEFDLIRVESLGKIKASITVEAA